MGLNLASIVTEGAARLPDGPAVRLGDTALSYAELDERSARLAALLRERGMRPGDRIGVMLPNVLEFPVSYYGVLRAGGIVVPMNVLLEAARDRLLPRGFRRWDPARLARVRHRGARWRRRRRRRADRGRAGGLRGAAGRAGAGRRPRRHRRGRHRGDPLHVRDHRQTQGRRADPRQPLPQRRRLLPHDQRNRRRRRRLRRPAALPLLRADGQHERLADGRRLPHPGPEIRPRRGAGDDPARPRHPLLRGADDVRGAAAPPRPR